MLEDIKFLKDSGFIDEKESINLRTTVKTNRFSALILLKILILIIKRIIELESKNKKSKE